MLEKRLFSSVQSLVCVKAIYYYYYLYHYAIKSFIFNQTHGIKILVIKNEIGNPFVPVH